MIRLWKDFSRDLTAQKFKLNIGLTLIRKIPQVLKNARSCQEIPGSQKNVAKKRLDDHRKKLREPKPTMPKKTLTGPIKYIGEPSSCNVQHC